MDLGPLTTVFTPPSDCLASSAVWWIYTSCYVAPNCTYQLQGHPDFRKCLPPDYMPYTTAYYSPGLCPSGYTPACTSYDSNGTVTDAVYNCCPTYVSSASCLPVSQVADAIVGCERSIALPTQERISGLGSRR